MRRKYSLPKVGMLAIVVALVISVTAFFIYTYAAPSSPNWTLWGESWVTKNFNPADTENYGSDWKSGPNRLRNVKPGDTVDWWHGIRVQNGPTDDVIVGVQQDVFDLRTNQPIDSDTSLNGRGAWHSERSAKFENKSKWSDYAWIRKYNPADYHTTSMEALNGKSRLEDLHGELGKNKFMYTRVIKKEDMGKRICQRVYWSKGSARSTAGWTYSSYACAEVPYDYDVEPSVNVNSDYINAESATSVDGINAGLSNKGPAKTQGSSYALARFISRDTEVSSMDGASISLASGTTHDWSCAVVRLIKEQHRELNIDGSTCKEIIGNGGNNQLNVGLTTIATNATDTLGGVKLNSNDSLCYVAMVSGYNGLVSSTDFRYAIKCVKTSKRPKVQVWGGDIKTDKDVITSTTSNTIIGPDSQTIVDKPTMQSMGLWGTGLDRNGNILKGDKVVNSSNYGYKDGDKSDEHWSIICSEDSYGGNGNQRAYNKSTNAAEDLPNCRGNANNLTNEYEARTAVTTWWRDGSGLHQREGFLPCYAIADKNLVGKSPIIPGSPYCHQGVWDEIPNVKWISINSYGRHTYSDDKPDPAVKKCLFVTDSKMLDCGNTYVFRLKNVKLNELKNAKKLSLNFAGAADNYVRVKINGYEMDTVGNAGGTSSGVQHQGWALPGFTSGSRFTAEMKPGTVLYGDGNVIDIYVKSNPSHMGLVISDISLSYTMDRTYQNMYGSWGEYGIIANGNAESASGAGLSSSFNGRSGVNPRDYNKLTFANTPKFGNFSSASSVPDNFTLPSIGGTRGNISGNVDVNSLASGEYNAGNVTLTGSKLSVGKSIVIKSSGVVRISGDLLYTDTNDVRQLPQLIIYAKNIIIEPSVGEVNAWLITQKDGYVSTCGVVINFGSWLSGVSDVSCGKQLKINGPIKTGRLFLRRAYGGKHASSAKNDPNMHPGTPAEIINLRADTYIWAYNNYRNTGAISTMNVRELPPRY